MAGRLQLQALLEEVIGTRSVYFQPPPSLLMQYPAIVYHRASVITEFANDLPYTSGKQYEITIIDWDPDSELPDKVGKLPMTRFVRHFASDQLNHDIYNMYF